MYDNNIFSNNRNLQSQLQPPSISFVLYYYFFFFGRFCAVTNETCGLKMKPTCPRFHFVSLACLLTKCSQLRDAEATCANAYSRYYVCSAWERGSWLCSFHHKEDKVGFLIEFWESITNSFGKNVYIYIYIYIYIYM